MKKILFLVLSKHSSYYFQGIKWKIIEGQGKFNYSQFFPEITKDQKESFNQLAYRWFRRFAV